MCRTATPLVKKYDAYYELLRLFNEILFKGLCLLSVVLSRNKSLIGYPNRILMAIGSQQTTRICGEFTYGGYSTYVYQTWSRL